MGSNGYITDNTALFRVIDIQRPTPANGAGPSAKGPLPVGKGQRPPKVKKAPKKPVTFALDPSTLNCLIVANLDEKEPESVKNGKGQWVTKDFTPEQRARLDRDSVLYYFQCILRCPTNLKFTAQRIAPPKVPTPELNPPATQVKVIRPLKLEFSNEKDAQQVLTAYNRNVLKLTM